MAIALIVAQICLFLLVQGSFGAAMNLLHFKQEQVADHSEPTKQKLEQVDIKDLILLTCNGSPSAIGENTQRNYLSYAKHELPHQTFLELNLDSSDWFNCISSAQSPLDGYKMEIVEVIRELFGSGAHRQLHSSITVKWKERKPCEVVMVEKLPRGIFADMFELDGLVQRGAWVNAAIYGDHNLELPMLHSADSIVVLHNYVETQSEDTVQINVSLPLHARYPPLSFHSHVAVSFTIPYVLLHCVHNATSNTPWSILTWRENVKATGLQWAVPSGNPFHSQVVAIITASTALAGVVILFTVSLKSLKQGGKMEG